MIRTFNDWKLSRKMLSAFAAIAVLMVGLGITGIATTNQLSSIASRHVTEGIVGTEALGRVIGYVREHRIIVYSLLNSDTPSEIEKLEGRFAKNKVDLKEAVDDFAPVAGALAPQLEQLRANVDKVEAINTRIFATKKQEGNAAILKLIKSVGKEASQGTIKHAEKLMALTYARSVAEDAAGRASAKNALVLIVGLLLVAVAGLFAIWRLISATVATPLAQLSTATKKLAEGGEAVVPHRERGDELGEVAKAVDLFRQAAVERAATDARVGVEQKMVVDTVSTHLSELSAGDLTATIETDFPGEYNVLKSNFNEALDKLRELIGAVGESAATIRTGSGEIAQASEDLARRTESNAASLEETAASVTQMDGRLKASAVAATKTVERADQAIATVGGGRAVADEAVQAMGRVSDSAKGIDSVIEGLDKIAFQTRVLAMNAAVEAGRAGDAGRGFAVVADLVSALAMRAEEEAKRARDQLTVTQTDIVTAVEAVTKVDGALANISGDVSQVHELLATMAADNQAQSAAITQISSAIGTMDQATQQNAAMVEETSAAARNLASEVGGLTEQASRFNVGNTAPAARQAAAPKARKADAKAYASPVKPLPAAGVTALVRADDNWNAF